MRKVILVTLGLALAMTACMPTARLSSGSTESFIKNFIEKHEEGELSTLRTYSIYKAPTMNGGLLELTAYKYREHKNLVVAASEQYLPPAKGQPAVQEGKTAFVQLTPQQAKAVVSNYKVLIEKMKNETLIPNETVYHDFTASPDLYVSFSKVPGAFAAGQSLAYLHVWVKGNKFTVSAADFISKLELFLNY